MLAAVLLVALSASAYAHSAVECDSGLPPRPDNGTAFGVINPGGNPIAVGICTAADNSTCAQDAIWCNMKPLAVNKTTYVQVKANASDVVLAYHTPYAFNWHRIESAEPLVAPIIFPPSRTDGYIYYTLPYPAPGKAGSLTQLCDSTPDCPSGWTCNTGTFPHVCDAPANPKPSPGPSPSPGPPPSPTPAPLATTCNLTGSYTQPYLQPSGAHRLGHGPSARVNVTMVAGSSTAFTFNCTSTGNRCPGGLNDVNGTGAISQPNKVVLTLNGTGTTVTGKINDTLACSPVVFDDPKNPGVTLQWHLDVSSGKFNLDVAVSTYLASPESPFVGVGVAILSTASDNSSAVVAVAGNGPNAWGGKAPSSFLGANASSNGTIVVMRVPIALGGTAAPTVMSVSKVGSRLDYLRGNGNGDVGIAGDFGVAVFSADAGSGALTLKWNDSLADIEPGTCGVCCNNDNYGKEDYCHLDVGTDGTTAAYLAAQGLEADGREGFLVGVWAGSGERLGFVMQSGKDITATVVDSTNKKIIVSYFYDSDTGKEPMVMPGIAWHDYSHARPGTVPTPSLPEAFRDFPWDSGHPYRTPGVPCNGDVADARVMGLRIGNDGRLIIAGRSDGGDTPWRCGLRDVYRETPFVTIDNYNTGSFMAAQAITNLVIANLEDGEAEEGQIMLGRLSNQAGNTLITRYATTGSNGFVYAYQDAACCLPHMANNTINGKIQLAGPSDASAFAALTPSLGSRLHWTHFSTPEDVGPQRTAGMDVSGGAIVLLGNSAGSMASVNPIEGAKAPAGGKAHGAPIAHLVALPEMTSPQD